MKNFTLGQYKFLTSRQDEAEKIDDFVNKLKTLSYEWELKELRDSLMIIIGTNDLRLQEKLLSETVSTLEFAIKAGQTTKATRRRAELQRKPKEVNFTKSEKKKTITSRRKKKAGGNSLSQRAELPSPTEKKITECKFCSYSHFRGN